MTVRCFHVETSVRGFYIPPTRERIVTVLQCWFTFHLDASAGRRSNWLAKCQSKGWNPRGRKIRSGMVRHSMFCSAVRLACERAVESLALVMKDDQAGRNRSARVRLHGLSVDTACIFVLRQCGLRARR